MNKYNVIYMIKYSFIDAIIIFHNPAYTLWWIQFLSSLKPVTNNNDSNMPLMCYIQLIK